MEQLPSVQSTPIPLSTPRTAPQPASGKPGPVDGFSFSGGAAEPGLIPRDAARVLADAQPTTTYQAAVSRIRASVDRDLALQQAPGEDGLYLQPNSQSIFMSQPRPDAKGTVVMYHGYTAVPWQYKEMAQRFFEAGYNVWAPRMPGHGVCDATGTPTGKDIPDSFHKQRWDEFIDQTFDDASGLGAPVYTVGLSGGADLALRAAERHPDVKGVAALSPYLGGNAPKGLLFPVNDILDKVTFGAVGHVLDHVPFESNPHIPNDPTPHTRGSLGQALTMQEVGAEVKHIDAPVQMITTDGDLLSGSNPDGRLFNQLGGADHNGWYRFHHNEGVPHALLSPLENKVPGAAQKVEDIVFNFIDKGERTQRS